MHASPAINLRHRRSGAILTTEMIFILPVFVIVGLIIIQFIIIHAAYERVQSAALAGAELAAEGEDIDSVHSGVGLVLGFMAGDYQTQMQYVDEDGDFSSTPPDNVIEETDDYVAVGVRFPMGLVTTNYLGLLGGSVNDLQIQAIVCKKMDVEVEIP